MNIAISSSILSLFLASIVITSQQIRDALPIGTTEAEVISYLEEVASWYKFVPRETKTLRTMSYPWIDTEIGYYTMRINKVRKRWWTPSFGSIFLVRIGISSEKRLLK